MPVSIMLEVKVVFIGRHVYSSKNVAESEVSFLSRLSSTFSRKHKAESEDDNSTLLIIGG
jgi:hypothetical protein